MIKKEREKNCSLSGKVVSGGVNLHEVVEDAKALSRVWDIYGALLKKHRLAFKIN